MYIIEKGRLAGGRISNQGVKGKTSPLESQCKLPPPPLCPKKCCSCVPTQCAVATPTPLPNVDHSAKGGGAPEQGHFYSHLNA